MRTNRHAPLAALIAAGILWGTTIPLTKVALTGLSPGWLAAARFTLAALPLAWVARRHLRAAISPATAGWGVFGYGGVIVLQNAGIARTSVSHAALIAGAAPVLVGLFTVALRRGRVRPVAWLGFAVTLAGVGVIASHGGGGATVTGDALVFGSVLLSAAFVVAQPGMLVGRDPVAVTAVQLGAAAVGTVLAALLAGGVPAALPGPVPLLALAGLAAGGTLAPFTLFAYGQSRISPEIAGAFLNLEPLTGAVIGALAFGNPVGPAQLAGGIAVLGGIGLAATPLLGGRRRGDASLRHGGSPVRGGGRCRDSRTGAPGALPAGRPSEHGPCQPVRAAGAHRTTGTMHELAGHASIRTAERTRATGTMHRLGGQCGHRGVQYPARDGSRSGRSSAGHPPASRPVTGVPPALRRSEDASLQGGGGAAAAGEVGDTEFCEQLDAGL